MSGNGEYISREAAKKQMRNGCHSLEWLLASGAKTIGDSFEIILDEVPAADVRPVVRGTWVGIDDYPHEDWECDHCGSVVEGTDDPWNYYHFCPNCGARMEES